MDELGVAQSFFHSACTSQPDLVNDDGLTFVVSLGSLCIPAHTLARLGMRKFAGPFDWIFSSPAMVQHMLEDDFATFLDQSQITTSAKFRFKAGHRFYSKMLANNTGDSNIANVIFNHHDPSCDDGHAYFQRTVHRFRHCLKCRNAKVFLICSLEYRERMDDSELVQLFIYLVKSARVTNFELVAIKMFAHLPPTIKATKKVAQKRTRPCSSSSSANGSELLHLRMHAGGCCMRVHELHCRGDAPLAGDGLTLTDEADNRDFEAILFATHGRTLAGSIARDPLHVADNNSSSFSSSNRNRKSNSNSNSTTIQRFCKAKHL